LDLVGVAAAPATELAVLLDRDLQTPAGKNLTAMTLWSWSRVFDATLEGAVLPSSIPVIDRLATECIESLYDLLARQETERPLEQGLLSVRDLTGIEPWRSLLAANTPGTLPADIPLFLSQGSADRFDRLRAPSDCDRA
jgi:hypothetical protein